MSDAEWHAWRAGGITATDVANAANDTYGGAYEVVARKLGLYEARVTDVMQRGHDWQPRIADAVHALTGLHVVGEETWCESSEDPLIRATVDGFLSPLPEASIDDVIGVLEIKTWNREKPNWDRWEDQVQWQMLATGLDYAVVAHARIDDDADSDLDKFRGLWVRHFVANKLRQSFLQQVASDLWAHVTNRTLPEPSSGKALDAVRQVTAVADPDADAVDLSDIASDVARLAEVKAAIRSVEDERDHLDAKIRDAIGSATSGVCDGYRVTYARPKNVLTAEGEARLLTLLPECAKTVLDRAAAKKANKELYAEHTEAIGARVLTIKEIPNE